MTAPRSVPRSVILTGTSSFVGAHLAASFARAGWAVTATHGSDRVGYDGIRAARLRFAERAGAALAPLDITDGGALRDLAARIRPALWVHHAGYATNYAAPDYDRTLGDAINVAPLDPIFAAMADTGGGVIVTGSSAEYAASDQANREDETGEPDMPYGQSKKAETEHARVLSEQTGVPVRVGRLYIPFGRLDHPAKLLAQVMDGLSAGQPVDLSACTQRRDFIGVADVCDAWLKMAGDLNRGGFDLFNICSGEAVELRALLLEIAAAMNADPDLLRFGARGMRPGETPLSYGDNTKARTQLSWQPRPLALALREDLLTVTIGTAQ